MEVEAKEGETVTVTAVPENGYAVARMYYITGYAGGFVCDSAGRIAFVNGAGELRLIVKPDFGAPDFTLPGGVTAIEANAFEGAAMRVVSISDGCGALVMMPSRIARASRRFAFRTAAPWGRTCSTAARWCMCSVQPVVRRRPTV